MIKSEMVQEYENFNKIYIPQNLFSQEYKYTLSGDTLTIVTNENCTTSYNTTQCDCVQYNIKYNVTLGEGTYRCNRNPNANNLISINNIATDINYSDRITEYYKNNYIILYGIVIIVLLFTIVMKKNSRNI